MSAYIQVIAPNLGQKAWAGDCLFFTWAAFGSPPGLGFAFARQAWGGQHGRHPGELPPKGVMVPVWFDHFGTYGRPPEYKNWGHAAVSLGDGRILSSPATANTFGQTIFASIAALERGLNATYLGWSECMDSTPVVKEASIQKGKDDMPRILNLRTTTDHTKPAATENKIYFDGGPGVGIKHIASPAHLKLLERFLADKPGERFYAAELATINAYLAPDAPTLSAATVEQAVTSAIKAAGGSVEAAAVAKAVEQALLDDFAAIPARVAAEQAERLRA